MPLIRIIVVLLLATLCGRSLAIAQRFIHNPPSLDTARRSSPACDTLNFVQHFQTKAKYPVRSETLAARANAWLQKEGAVDTAATGVISFRFLVDCEGKPSGFYCEQSSLQWEPLHFRDAAVLALYRFVLSLAPMPIGTVYYPSEPQPTTVNYFTYFSFILRNGKVQSVAP